MSEKVIAEFRGIIPDIQSAIKLGGTRESRVQFDVSAADQDEVMKLARDGTMKVLRVMVREEDG